MAKVYVSSTFQDLQDYQRRVSRTLRMMGHEDVAMEYFIAEDRRPVEKCLDDVAACDVYVGLFAWRYGWQPRKNNRRKLSITEMEYRQALRSGKTCLIFLLDEDAPWPRSMMDRDDAQIMRLRAELSEEHGPSLFTSPDDLAAKLTTALHKWAAGRGQLVPPSAIAELDLTAYFNALARRYQRLDLDALTPPQKDKYLQLQLRLVYVEQSVREEPPPVELPKEMWERLRRDGEALPEDLPSGMSAEDVLRARELYFEKPPRPVLDALTDERHRHGLVLGDPGSGKSTLARYLVMSLVNEDGDPKLRAAFPEHLPLLIELRAYAGLCAEGRCDTFLEFVGHMSRSEGWGLDAAALDAFLKRDGRALVVFDGLDEIFNPEERERAAQRIAGFANTYPKARVVVTSRVVGYRRRVLDDAGFSHFTLQDLDEEQVAAFVDKWYALALSDRPDEATARRERILTSFRESASIRQLAGNPMLLTIMAIIGKHQELPRERWKLYDHAASVLIQHWDVNKHLRDRNLDAAFIGEDDKKELLRRLAYKMQGGEGGLAGNYVHREQLQEEFEGYLRDRYAQPPDRAKLIAEAMIQQFRERNFILSLYGAGLYGFVHRAFLEFFCATAFTHKFEKTRELSLEDLKDLYTAHWENRPWHEVLRLICGMLDPAYAGELIDHLSTTVYRPWPKKFGDHQPQNIALAVQCLGEVKDINTVAEPAERLLGVLCSLFDYLEQREPELFLFIDHEIFSAVETIGPNWPGRAVLGEWLRKSAAHESFGDFHAGMKGTFMGVVGSGSEELYQLVSSFAPDERPSARLFATYALVRGWPNKLQVAQILRQFTKNDPEAIVRRRAASMLADYFSDDPETYPLLRHLAVEDGDDNVRSSAVWRIEAYFGDRAETFPLFINRAVNDPSPSSERPEIFGGVRAVAIEGLAEHWGSRPETLALLRERAENDPTPWLRERAKELADEVEEKARRG
jgi:energy-coupling factor transporter ATP-binding protein EcfA2